MRAPSHEHETVGSRCARALGHEVRDGPEGGAGEQVPTEGGVRASLTRLAFNIIKQP